MTGNNSGSSSISSTSSGCSGFVFSYLDSKGQEGVTERGRRQHTRRMRAVERRQRGTRSRSAPAAIRGSRAKELLSEQQLIDLANSCSAVEKTVLVCVWEQAGYTAYNV